MIERKIWKGDVLNLAEGNSFWGGEVVHHRAGYAVVSKDAEAGDPLVEIDGGSYIVKRSDLSELSERQNKIFWLTSSISTPEALTGIGPQERRNMAAELKALLQA